MKRAPLLLILLLVACASDAPVAHDYNPTVDFSTYESFSFTTPSVSAGEGSVAYDVRVMDTIRGTIREDLRSRPMTNVRDGGDLSISISLTVAEETGVDQWGVTWDGGGTGTVGQGFQFKAGTMVIDFFDSATEQLVWRGWAESAVARTGDPDLEYLSKLVKATLAQYPPSAEEG